MKTPIFKFEAKVWIYSAPKAAWHFVSVPEQQSEQLRFHAAERIAGWGSIRIRATIGSTTWETSVFPDKKTGTYLLPLKAEVRELEHLTEGRTAKVSLVIA